MTTLNEKLQDELKKLPEGWIVLLESEPEKTSKVSVEALAHLTNNDYKGIVLSASRPCSSLLETYKKHNVKTENVYFIDCVSKTQNLKEKKIKNVIAEETVSDLTNIAIALNSSIKELKGKKFVLIDSINSMLIHNKEDVFARFIHSILTKLRSNQANGLLLAIKDDTARNIRAEIAQLCDTVITDD